MAEDEPEIGFFGTVREEGAEGLKSVGGIEEADVLEVGFGDHAVDSAVNQVLLVGGMGADEAAEREVAVDEFPKIAAGAANVFRGSPAALL